MLTRACCKQILLITIVAYGKASNRGTSTREAATRPLRELVPAVGEGCGPVRHRLVLPHAVFIVGGTRRLGAFVDGSSAVRRPDTRRVHRLAEGTGYGLCGS